MPDERPNTGSYQPKHYLADFGYSAKMPHWDEVEAVALLLGINPRFVNLREEYISGVSDRYKEQYFSLLNSARRSVRAEQIGDKLRPSDWLEWHRDFGIHDQRA